MLLRRKNLECSFSYTIEIWFLCQQTSKVAVWLLWFSETCKQVWICCYNGDFKNWLLSQSRYNWWFATANFFPSNPQNLRLKRCIFTLTAKHYSASKEGKRKALAWGIWAGTVCKGVFECTDREGTAQEESESECSLINIGILTLSWNFSLAYNLLILSVKTIYKTWSYTLNQKLLSVNHWKPALIFLPDFEILASPADMIDGFVSSLEIVVKNILCILVKYLKNPN